MKRLPFLLSLAFLNSAGSAPAAGYAIPAKVLKAEAKAFAKADKDGNETVSYDEFKALLKPLAAALKKFPATGRGDHPQELLDLCEAVFDYFDANADASIDSSEWLDARQNFNIFEIADLLKSLPGLDRNGNGRVRAMEFLPLVKSFIPLSKAKDIFHEIVHPYTYSGAIQTAVSGGTLSVSGSNSQIGVTSSLSGSTFTVELASGNNVLSPGASPGVGTLTLDLGLSQSWNSQDLGSITNWLNQGLAGQITSTLGGSSSEGTLLLPIDGSANWTP